jgi:hypothetical protein
MVRYSCDVAIGIADSEMRIAKSELDAYFVAKLRDVAGLYVDPPAHAIVLSLD